MKILCATDLLPKSEAAIDRAGILADSLAAPVTVLHAVPPDAPGGATLEQRVRRAESRPRSRRSPCAAAIRRGSFSMSPIVRWRDSSCWVRTAATRSRMP
jgi:nucleotide-binding universal stress UspA family protein